MTGTQAAMFAALIGLVVIGVLLGTKNAVAAKRAAKLTPYDNDVIAGIIQSLQWYAQDAIITQEKLIGVAQYLVSLRAHRRYYDMATRASGFSYETASNKVVYAADDWLTRLIEQAWTDSSAFEQVRDLMTNVVVPGDHVVKLFGSPPVIMSPFELFGRCGLRTEPLIERYREVRKLYVADA